MCNEHNSEVLYQLHPEKVRDLIRNGRLRKPTFGIATNYTHAGFVILPEQYAYDFLLYTQRNPKACPLLEVSEKGAREMVKSAKGSDIARDVTRYRIYEHGTLVGEACSIER